MSKAYLEIILKVDANNRNSAAAVYTKYKQPFLDKIKGAKSKELLIREEDVQVIHSFDTVENAKAYLVNDLFVKDVYEGLLPFMVGAPDVRVYNVV